MTDQRPIDPSTLGWSDGTGRGRGPGVSTDMVTLTGSCCVARARTTRTGWTAHHVGGSAKTLAADHDRIVAEAETRGWNAAVEAGPRLIDDVHPVSGLRGQHAPISTGACRPCR